MIKLMLPPAPDEVPIPPARFDAWLASEAKAFLFEAMVLSKIDSPYIPGVFEAATQHTRAGWDVPWFATELISGRSLAEQVGSVGPMDQNQLLDLAHDILSALTAIHHVGLVHLDLKPDNVMLEPGRARLIDFGLVTKANQKGRLGGTPGFFTPEQLDEVIEERDFAPAADVFKLGVTLAIAAGVRLPDIWNTDPFGDDATVRRAMADGPRLTSLGAVSRDVIAPMLAFDPRQRPTAAASLEQVRDLLPAGSSKGSGKEQTVGVADRLAQPKPPQPAERSARAAAGGQRPARMVSAANVGNANVGARVVVVDRLGLDWTGVVVGVDTKRPGNILIKHESTRGAENVRSYPLNQVVRGTPLK
ncbi:MULTISPECIES: protein kinase [unclassified Microbacterium]|uniref:protein kinase domain-containing protein n=1 Tax=unclassified Microbacterium TaxID=2609290 RepID=UPI00214AFD08|nr:MULTISPECIES: protein kinase [unclassified Microbacterium]MCR2784136.1 protein kinase [Microbacterium sp. zg.B96]WIM15028.1 protein kinase [Microbacterium sp. zg-B96]